MKRILFLSFIIFHLSLSPIWAQDALWISGSAVPGGTQELVKAGDEGFKFAGRLNAGELRVMTTKKATDKTTYILPVMTDALIVSNGLDYQTTADASKAAWQVPFAEDHYKFLVDTRNKTVRGEIFYPWGELFIAGGATEAGWKEGKMLLMQQDPENPYVWTWEGELKKHPEVEEPTSFKFQGQDRWYPKNLHPYQQGTDVLKDTRLRTGGSDNKWTISQEGRYRIRVDLFNETIQATIINN